MALGYTAEMASDLPKEIGGRQSPRPRGIPQGVRFFSRVELAEEDNLPAAQSSGFLPQRLPGRQHPAPGRRE